MRQFLPPLRLVGAEVLRDGMLQSRSVALDAGRITKGPLPEVDLRGFLVLPGIIDLDAPAQVQLSDTKTNDANSWIALDRAASACGVTTAFAREDWSWAHGDAEPGAVQNRIATLTKLRPGLGTDIYAQLHVETHTIEWAEALKSLADGATVRQVIFSNRLTPTLAQAEVNNAELARQAARAGDLPTAHLARLQALAKRSRDVPRFLCGLAEAFDQVGVLYGSQGDPDGETREFYSMIGARLCLRPYARSAAALARAVGDPVLLSAGDLVYPDEAQSSFSVQELVARYKLCALVSGGAFENLAQAAFGLADTGKMALPEAWTLISTRAAEIARLPDRGRIDYGQRADLVVVEARTRRIEATIANGRLTYLTGEAANRFLGAPAGFEHAAE